MEVAVCFPPMIRCTLSACSAGVPLVPILISRVKGIEIFFLQARSASFLVLLCFRRACVFGRAVGASPPTLESSMRLRFATYAARRIAMLIAIVLAVEVGIRRCRTQWSALRFTRCVLKKGKGPLHVCYIHIHTYI